MIASYFLWTFLGRRTPMKNDTANVKSIKNKKRLKQHITFSDRVQSLGSIKSMSAGMTQNMIPIRMAFGAILMNQFLTDEKVWILSPPPKSSRLQ
jgi:hypothetical protein